MRDVELDAFHQPEGLRIVYVSSVGACDSSLCVCDGAGRASLRRGRAVLLCELWFGREH